MGSRGLGADTLIITCAGYWEYSNDRLLGMF